ncbi:hypothetical protein [Roseateles agri]|uniref:hypothetical protein n=1 Tax=Roseateles agri TaxID=3098619 RepID=UPI002A59FFCB|nr:hypothetical protein [Paucibacter sp. R3-3]
MPAPRRRKQAASFEDQFHCSLGRLVHETARLDFLVGLQLNWLGQHCNVSVARYLDPTKCSLAMRLAKLHSLVKRAFKPAGPAALNEFGAWFEQAGAARALRNNYAHGRWGVPVRLDEDPRGPEFPRIQMLAFVALDWDMTPNQPDRSVYMSLESFQQQVADAVKVFNSYFKLSEKHLPHVGVPGRRS